MSFVIVISMHRIASVTWSIKELSLVAWFFRLGHVFMLVILYLLPLLIWKLKLISIQGLLSLSNIRRYNFRLFAADTRLFIFSLASVDLIPNYTTNAVFKIWGTIVLLRILELLFSHRMLLWGSCVWLLNHHIRLILRSMHISTTNAWFGPKLLVGISFPDLSLRIAETFLLNIFKFLLSSCEIWKLSKLRTWVTIDRPTHSLILFKNCSLMDFL